MGKFLGWMGGILAAIISGYVLWYLTRAPEKMIVEGMVIDSTLNVPVPNAMVSVEITSIPNNGPFHDPTDNNGAYGLELTGLSRRANVVLRVAARGFQEAAPASLVVIPGGNRKDLYVTPIAAPPPPVGSGGNPAVAVPAFPPKYIQKAAMMKVFVNRNR